MDRKRYTAVAIALHWTIAALIVAMIPMGWWMSDAVLEPATRAQAAEVFQLHKSIGLTILALTVVRLVWRLLHKPPPPPAGMPAWQRFAAGAVHALFYVALIAAPLSGWAYVSAGYSVTFERFFPIATAYFGLFEVPHVTAIESQSMDARREIAQGAMSAHSALAWAFIVLLVLHVGAALKHHFFDRDDTLARMVPGLKPFAKD